MRKLPELMPDNLAIIAWSFAKLGVHHVPLRTAISESSLPRIGDFRCLNISNIVWSLAELAVSDPPLMAAISSWSLPRIVEFRSQDLSNTAWAFAKLTIRDAPLIAAISSASVIHIGEDDQIISAFVWALWRGSEDYRCATSWSSLDVMAVAFMLMGAGWGREQEGEDKLWQLVVGRGQTPQSEASTATLAP